jgi:hypothetical protein
LAAIGTIFATGQKDTSINQQRSFRTWGGPNAAPPSRLLLPGCDSEEALSK